MHLLDGDQFCEGLSGKAINSSVSSGSVFQIPFYKGGYLRGV